MTQIIISAKYDWRLVTLSIAIAVYAAYIAFSFAARIAVEGRGLKRKVLWIAAGSTVMGLGLWSSQCIGMLSLVLPVPVQYDAIIIGLSLVAAIFSSSVAIFVISRDKATESYTAAAGVSLGVGVAALHYLGLWAMQFAASRVYNPAFAALTVVVAVAGTGAALQLARWRDPRQDSRWKTIASASIMGLTVCATHYAGMAALSFRYNQALAAGNHSVSGPSLSISGVALLTLAVLGVSLLGSSVEQKFAAQGQVLLSEKERWLMLAGATTDGLFDFDLLTGKAFYSARWKAIIGYNSDELESTQETWRRCLHPADRQAVEDNIARYSHQGHGLLEMEYRVLHRDHSTRWVFARAQAIWNNQLKPVRLISSCTDITARKQSEEKLLLSESRYRALFEANPMPSWIYSPIDHRIQDVNQAALEYFCWSRDQFIGKSIDSIRMPGEEQSFGPQENLGDRSRTTPWRLRRKNKSGIWVELTNYDIEGTEHPARLMIANDVTAYVVKEAKIEHAKGQLEGLVAQKNVKLQTIEAQWHGLVEALPQMVWAIRPDGSCDYSNTKWSEFTGLPKERVLEFGWLDAIHPQDRATVQTAYLAGTRTGERFTLKYKVRHHDGSYRDALALVVPVRPNINEPISHWLGSATIEA